MVITKRAIRKIVLLHPIYQANKSFSALWEFRKRDCQKNLEMPYIEGQLYFSADRMIISLSKLCTIRWYSFLQTSEVNGNVTGNAVINLN